MTVNLSFIGGAGWQFFDNNGKPLSGGKIYTYLAGTTTPQATYTSRSGLIANTNPIILDSAGRTPEEVWSTEGILYKYVIVTSTDLIIRTWDNIGGSVVASDLAQDLANTTDNSKGDALIGFVQSDSSGFLNGATSRTVNSKLQETVSVKDFGAVGDGVADDTAAIQKALNSPATSISFPTGTYLVSGQTAYTDTSVFGKYCLDVPSNKNLIGDGATIKLQPTQITTVFDVRGVKPSQPITGWVNGDAPNNYTIISNTIADNGAWFTLQAPLSTTNCGYFSNYFTLVAGHTYTFTFRMEVISGNVPGQIEINNGTYAFHTTLHTIYPVAGVNTLTFTATNETHIVFKQVGAVTEFAVYDLLLEDITSPATTSKENVAIEGLRFVSEGDYTCNAIRGSWVNNLQVRNNQTYGMGLLWYQDPDCQQTYWDNLAPTGIYYTITTQGGIHALPTGLIVENNNVFGYAPQNTYPAPTSGSNVMIGIDIDFTLNAKVINNTIDSVYWGIYGQGAAPNPGVNLSDTKNTRWLIGATITDNTVRNTSSGAVWFQTADKLLVANNWVSTSDDVGIELEGCMNCVVEGNYAEHCYTGNFAQQRYAYNNVFRNNVSYNDGTLRGFQTSTRRVIMFGDSVTDASDATQRHLILENNTFIYKQGDIKASETGQIFTTALTVTDISRNTFINTVISNAGASTIGYSVRDNNLYFTGTFALPHPTADYTNVLIAISVPNADSLGNASGDVPVRISGNRIECNVAVPTPSIGINYPYGFSGNDGTYDDNVVIIENNVISPKFVNGIQFTNGGVYGATCVLRGNICNYITDYTWNAGNTAGGVTEGKRWVNSSNTIWDGNKKNNGQDLFATTPVNGVFSAPFRFYYQTPPGNYIGSALTTSGAAWKEVWSGANAYIANEQIKASDGKVYIALQASTNQNPTTSPTYWAIYGDTPAVWREFGLMA